MSLTDTAIRTAKVQDKAYKLYDERGLFLLVTPTGSLLWRFKYRFAGVEKLLSLGIYPDVRLKDARDRRDDARRLVAAGADPSVKRQVEKNARANTFAAVAEEWLENKRATLSESTCVNEH
jgi:Arm DNA-binding domain